MYKELIRSIQNAVAFNLDNADKADVQRSSFAAGMVRGYLDVLRSLATTWSMALGTTTAATGWWYVLPAAFFAPFS